MKALSTLCICTCFCSIVSIATATVLVRSGSRSKHILLRPGSRSFDKESIFQQPRGSFNRPPGTVALQTNVNTRSFANTYGRISGQYGSYRNHRTWQQAVIEDNRRHGLPSHNLKETFPWLFKNIHTPSLRGFGLDGFWNSYSPYIPDAISNGAKEDN